MSWSTRDRIPAREIIFLFLEIANLSFSVYRGSAPRLQQPGREAEYTHLFSSLRMSGVVGLPLFPLYVSMAWSGIALRCRVVGSVC